MRSNVLYRSLYGHDFHIGVGSDVVCSTTIGNCKSLRKWNGQQDDSTLFFCRNLTDFCLEKSLQGELIDDFLISNFEDYCMIPMKYDILRQRTIMMRVI